MGNTKAGSFEQLLEGAQPEHKRICTALRDAISARHPDYVEVIWQKQKIASYGVGQKKMSEHYAYIAPQKNHVNLGFYHGTSLPDPAGLLEGTGKRLRHVKIRTIEDTRSMAVDRLLAEAVDELKRSLA